MFEFFERRTKEHIERVRKCLALLAEVTGSGEELIERARIHDASKFGPEEWIPYVWLTEYHRCRRNGEAFEYPEGVGERVKVAVRHHVTTNRHHPGISCRSKGTCRTLTSSKWCATGRRWPKSLARMAVALADGRTKRSGSASHSTRKKREFIYRMIESLDKQIATNP